ncbi:ketopantoate reductase family protein [Sphingobium nicotianae]|uniref:2-dehydropantoate 2-reductase n=1 Tax=Sphingobium nicotianae TaxID=2782607 RepID=A0A9X1IRE4_9SPHN|nr:2-dehydropantoate 2-reductase [Sphingobium nicotianae]MBT2187381.1 2-dehydropantoate 2-reductase [Sphingobium nicotianae]
MTTLSSTPSVAIIGAGAMGCLFAARMAEQGARVTLVDVDKARLDAIAQNGITLKDDNGTRTLPVGASLAADLAGPVELVVLFTKGMHSEAAVKSVAHLAASKPIALTLQNGIGNAELLAAGFGADQVLLGTAHVPADLNGPSSVATHGFGHLDVGGFTLAAQSFAAPVAALLQASGFDTHVAQDINAAVWEKVAFNGALNATGMICQVPNAGIDNEPGRRIAVRIVDETVAVAAANGIVIDRDRIVATVDQALREHAHHKASMLQDREHGRRTEIETINGAIAREGARLGVPTPVCDTLSDLVRVIELASSR